MLLDEYGFLICPKCNKDNLHQINAKVIFRDTEDSNGTLAIIGTKKVFTTRVLDKAIEGRRDVIYIDFWCENCKESDNIHTLRIMQHKGNTIIDWK